MKKFRIIECVFRPTDHSHSIIVIAADAEAYRVKLSAATDWQELRHGLLLEMPLVKVQEGNTDDLAMRPDWALIGDWWEQIVHDSPWDAVAKSWGRDEAAKHFPPEFKAEANSPPTPPAPPKLRKRRGSKHDAPPSGSTDEKP